VTAHAAWPPQPTTARWLNRERRVRDDHEGGWYTKWRKVLAHTGPYEQFAYGTDTPSDWPDRGHARRQELQKALICSPWSGLIAVDVDYEQEFAGTRTGKLIGRAQALTTRGRGFHILLDCRGIPPQDWPPRQVPIAGADIKSKGFIPVPGCWHYSGERYELTDFGRHGRGYVTGWPELIEAIKADQADQRQAGGGGNGGGGGEGGGHDGEVAATVLGNILRGLDKEQCYAEWVKIAIPHNPGDPFTREDFERHYGDESRGALAKAEQIRAEEREAWAELMAWRAS
jgi:hypothetical protein